MSTLEPQWAKICTFENLLLAFQKACKGKRNRPDVAWFNFNLEQELFNLLDELISLRYQPGLYRSFNIYERKPRIISVAPFRDRVVHHALMNVLEPIIDRLLVNSTFACRKGKGVHMAVDFYQRQSRRFAYVLKMDVQKYFPSINQDILKGQLVSIIKDNKVLLILNRIIDGCNTLECAGRGLPIGNLTSQILANLYLNDIDHWMMVQQDFAYIRYVGDLFVLGNSKAHLWRVKKELDQKLAELKLQLHSHKSHIFLTREKVDVLGYKVTRNKRWLRNENGFRMARKLKSMSQQYADGRIGLQNVNSSVASWVGHAQHAETLGLRGSMLNKEAFTKS